MNNLFRADLYKTFRSTALFVLIIINLVYSFIWVLSNHWYTEVLEEMDSEAVTISYEESAEYQAGYQIGMEIGKTLSGNKDIPDEELRQRADDVTNKRCTMSDVVGVFFTFNSIPYFMLAILAGINVTAEFSSGPVRNTIAKGYSRTKVFFSRVLVTFIEGILLNTAMLTGGVIGCAVFCETGVLDMRWLLTSLLYIFYAAVFCMAYSFIYTAIGFAVQTNATIAVNILFFIFGGVLLNVIQNITHLPTSSFWISSALENEYIHTYLNGTPLLFADNIAIALGYIIVFGGVGMLIFKKRDIH